jgi:hypothetical protein
MEGGVTKRGLKKNDEPTNEKYKSKVYKPILFSVLT